MPESVLVQQDVLANHSTVEWDKANLSKKTNKQKSSPVAQPDGAYVGHGARYHNGLVYVKKERKRVREWKI